MKKTSCAPPNRYRLGLLCAPWCTTQVGGTSLAPSLDCTVAVVHNNYLCLICTDGRDQILLPGLLTREVMNTSWWSILSLPDLRSGACLMACTSPDGLFKVFIKKLKSQLSSTSSCFIYSSCCIKSKRSHKGLKGFPSPVLSHMSPAFIKLPKFLFFTCGTIQAYQRTYVEYSTLRKKCYNDVEPSHPVGF